MSHHITSIYRLVLAVDKLEIPFPIEFILICPVKQYVDFPLKSSLTANSANWRIFDVVAKVKTKM